MNTKNFFELLIVLFIGAVWGDAYAQSMRPTDHTGSGPGYGSGKVLCESVNDDGKYDGCDILDIEGVCERDSEEQEKTAEWVKQCNVCNKNKLDRRDLVDAGNEECKKRAQKKNAECLKSACSHYGKCSPEQVTKMANCGIALCAELGSCQKAMSNACTAVKQAGKRCDSKNNEDEIERKKNREKYPLYER